MKHCYECGKSLKFWEGYYHPTMGKNRFICWNCFQKIDQSIEQYRDFILTEFNQKEPKTHIENIIRKSKSKVI
jgi:recombinational DNA repair protein (RecF pathway)